MASNPYAPPRAAVADVQGDVEFQPVKIWSASGRIGRLRYLAHISAAYCLVAVFAGGLIALARPVGIGIAIIGYVAFIVFSILKLIQRSHDMNWSGWTCLLSFIPFVGLIWLFKAGTDGENQYGGPPPPNTTGVKVLGLLLPAIAFIGILAAIALPAYQQYVLRAKAAEHTQPIQSESDAEDEDSAPAAAP